MDKDTCPYCRSQHGKIYPVELFLGLPHTGCTSAGGCRCYEQPSTSADYLAQLSKTRIQNASIALRDGNKESARQMLAAVVTDEPSNAQAWYLLSYAADDLDQARYCIAQAAKYSPTTRQVLDRQAELQPSASSQIPGYQRQQAAPIAPVAPRPARQVSLPFYREPAFKIAMFLLLTPIWVLIVLTDPSEGKSMKIAAVVVQVFLCLFGFWVALNGYMNLTS